MSLEGANGSTLQEPPRWFIRGAYVLDVIFGRQSARDVDVFFDRTKEAPKSEDIEAFLELRGWWIPRQGVTLTGIAPGDFETRGNWEDKRFNVDQFYIDMTGLVGVILDGHGPQPLPLDEAKERIVTAHLQLLPGKRLPEPNPPGEDQHGNLVLSRILIQLGAHPELDNPAIRQQVEYLLSDFEYDPGDHNPINTELD